MRAWPPGDRPGPAEELSRYDARLVATAHGAFRDPALYERVRLVVDTGNLMRAAGPFVPVKA